MLEIFHIFNSSSSSDSRASTHSKPLATLLTLEKATANFTEAFFYSTSTKIRNFPLVVVFSPQLKHGGKRRTWHKRLKKVLSTSPFKCKRVSRAKERRKKETKKKERKCRDVETFFSAILPTLAIIINVRKFNKSHFNCAINHSESCRRLTEHSTLPCSHSVLCCYKSEWEWEAKSETSKWIEVFVKEHMKKI